MKLIVEIKYKDDRVEKFTCVDFPLLVGEFILLYEEGFKRTNVKSEGVAEMKHYFKV